MTANNNKAVATSNPKQEGTFKEVDTPVPNDGAIEVQGGDPNQPQVPDLNDIVLDLKNISGMCNQKVVEYADITAVFKQIGFVTNNLALALSVYLQDKGELDPKRFKLVK